MKKFLMLFVAIAICFSCSSSDDDVVVNLAAEAKEIITHLSDDYPVIFTFNYPETGGYVFDHTGKLFIIDNDTSFILKVEENEEIVWNEEYNYSDVTSYSDTDYYINVEYYFSDEEVEHYYQLSMYFENNIFSRFIHYEYENDSLIKYLNCRFTEVSDEDIDDNVEE